MRTKALLSLIRSTFECAAPPWDSTGSFGGSSTAPDNSTFDACFANVPQATISRQQVAGVTVAMEMIEVDPRVIGRARWFCSMSVGSFAVC